MASYADINSSAQTGKKGGYKPALYFVLNDDVSEWKRPLDVPLVLGDKVKITEAHVLAADKVTHKWDAKLYSVRHTSDPVGDAGAREFMHKATVIVLGDNAATFEQMVMMLNDNKTIFLKDADCLTNNSYIQLGDDCNPVEVSTVFDGNVNSPEGGQKAYTLELSSKSKYFYLADLPEEAP